MKNLVVRALALMLGIMPAILQADFGAHSFAEPFSGQKVNSYQVELSVKKNRKQPFAIPSQCHQIMEVFNRGADDWSTSVERQLWFKVVNDCRYVSFLHVKHKPAVQDFVSQYDFFNARLEDLPFASECQSENPTTTMEDCPPFPPGILNLSKFFPFLEMEIMNESVDSVPCRFTNGMFRGRLVRSSQKITCIPDRRAPGLRLMSVDFSDLNGDGFQDALLRILPLGRGFSRMPILLPLTRKSQDEKFSIASGSYLDNF